MKTIRAPMARFWGAAVALASTALASSAAFATGVTPCSRLSGTFPNGGTQGLSVALGYNGEAGTPVVLSIQAQDVAANAFYVGLPSPPVCSVEMVVASDGNPADSQIQIA